MKKFWFITAILTLALAFGLMLASCKSGGGGGTFRITGIPDEYNGMYAMLAITSKNNDAGVFAGGDKGGVAAAFSGMTKTTPISNGSVTFHLWMPNEDAKTLSDATVGYKGNDTFNVSIGVFKGESIFSDTVNSLEFDSIKFSNGSATTAWNDAQRRRK